MRLIPVVSRSIVCTSVNIDLRTLASLYPLSVLLDIYADKNLQVCSAMDNHPLTVFSSSSLVVNSQGVLIESPLGIDFCSDAATSYEIFSRESFPRIVVLSPRTILC